MKRFPVKHKYNAKITIHDGIRFDSQKEAKYYEQLKMAQKIGRVLFFLRQIPIHLPGGVTMRVDFQVFYTNGTVRFIDVKGMRTKQYIDKKKMVEALYPIEIEEV